MNLPFSTKIEADARLNENHYAYEITVDGEVLVQVRKRLYGSDVAYALAVRLLVFINGGQS